MQNIQLFVLVIVQIAKLFQVTYVKQGACDAHLQYRLVTLLAQIGFRLLQNDIKNICREVPENIYVLPLKNKCPKLLQVLCR